ncbi:subtilisin-like protein [Thozetella sp. PMI_491]|nr:subtilisin-like protein [Thozetella sp. PMI_491]
MEVSDPASDKYGQTWTAEEVIDAFRPADETVEAVKQWLAFEGISDMIHSDNKGWIAFDAPTSVVEGLLHTEFHEYQDSLSGDVRAACDKYHVPKNIQHHIDYITPGVKLVAPLKAQMLGRRATGLEQGKHGHPPLKHAPGNSDRLTNTNDLAHCDEVITPACIAALYGIPQGYSAIPGNSMGIYESLLEFWDQEDLDLFFSNYAPRIPKGTHPIDYLIDGAVAETTNVSEAGGETMLDLDLAYPIVYPQTITIWNEDDLNYQGEADVEYLGGFNTWLDAMDGSYCTYSAYGETGDDSKDHLDPLYPDPLPGGYKGKLQCGVFKPTNVMSISYGGPEHTVPIAYQKRQCNEFLKLGLQGVSFFFASGDAGVGEYPPPYGDGCVGPDQTIFTPDWPVNCPYVTAVGATKVYPGHTVFQPESVVLDFVGDPYAVNYSSGGGFSNIYPQPDYQKAAVATYLTKHDPGHKYYSKLAADAPNPVLPDPAALSGNTGGIYNRIGRGYPDVAANGDNIATYAGGEFGLSGGTSASTPIFAAVINRINEERLKVGKKSVGFLNPTFYAHPEIFNDITNGTNIGCGVDGFPAAPGWDPSTGLGTPNYPKMLKFFLSLP